MATETTTTESPARDPQALLGEMSRADVMLVLRDLQPPEDKDEDRAARRRLWDAVRPS